LLISTTSKYQPPNISSKSTENLVELEKRRPEKADTKLKKPKRAQCNYNNNSQHQAIAAPIWLLAMYFLVTMLPIFLKK